MANILKFLGFDSFMDKSVAAYKTSLNDITSRVDEILGEVDLLAKTSLKNDLAGIVKGYKDELNSLSNKKESLLANFSSSIKNHLQKGFRYEHAMNEGLGRQRSDMPQVNQNDLDSYLIHFAGNSKDARVTKCKMKLNKLKPSQEDIDVDKVITGLTNDNWKERNYIVSQDNHIIDGHHSWASGLEIEPNTEVTVYKINLPAKELIRRTKLLKITRGGDIDMVKGCFETFFTKNDLPTFFEDYDMVVGNGTLLKLKAGEPVTQSEIIKGDVCDVVMNKDGFEKADVFVDGVGERSFYVQKKSNVVGYDTEDAAVGYIVKGFDGEIIGISEDTYDYFKKSDSKNIHNLVKKQVYVTRDGHTFLQTVYVKKDTGESVETPIGEELSPSIGGLEIEKYSDKSISIKGNTYANKDLMRKVKDSIGSGLWNSTIKGWIFPLSKKDSVLGIIYSELKANGNNDEAEVVKNQKNELDNGTSVTVGDLTGTIVSGASDIDGVKYDIKLDDGTGLSGVSEKAIGVEPERDDSKIAETINNAVAENRNKTEKKIYGVKPVSDIHKYSLSEYLEMHGLTPDDYSSAIKALKGGNIDKTPRTSTSSTTRERSDKNKTTELTKKQLISKLIHSHYQAVKAAIERGEEVPDKSLELYEDLQTAYKAARKPMSEETKEKIREYWRRRRSLQGLELDVDKIKPAENDNKDYRKLAEDFINSLTEEQLCELKNVYKEALNTQSKGQRDKLETLVIERDLLQKEFYDKHAVARGMENYRERHETQEYARSLSPKINILDKKILGQKNSVQAVDNGGDLVTFTDKIGIEHKGVPDFTKIDTSDISYDIDTILVDEKPKYIPTIDEDAFRRRGYTLDAVRLSPDTYMVASSSHDEQGGYLNGKPLGYNPELAGYVILTLDQLVLTNDYYITKQKAIYKKEADDKNKRTEAHWDTMDEKSKATYLSERNVPFGSLPVSVKKQLAKDGVDNNKWAAMSVSEKEKYYKPIKKHGPEKLKTTLESNKMWTSFHTMTERFVNPELKRTSRNGKTPLNIDEVETGSYGNPYVFQAWYEFSDMLKWKLNDIKIQKENDSEIYKQALETSFGNSNTNDSLKSEYGILVKRQNGEAIKPKEIEELKEAWSSVQKSFGIMKDLSNESNLKLSHTGKTNIFASKAIGVYISKMKTIGVSAKYGADSMSFTLGHESAHFIDNMLGTKNGKRFASDNFESTAGQIAMTFRNNMNAKSVSDYTNSTTECFARALEQYHAIESFGENAEMAQRGRYFASEDYVSKQTYETQIKPLIRQFLSENKEFLKSLGFDFDNFEKAEYGIYADNAQNRKLNRVGEKYSKDTEDDEPKPSKTADDEDKNTRKHNQQLTSFAKEATDKELQDAVKNKELGEHEKSVAEKELKARGLVDDEEESVKVNDGKMKKEDLVDILDKAQISNSVKVSHIYGSMYFMIGGNNYRVSDHPPIAAEKFYKLGENDFRSIEDLHEYLNKNEDLTDKTKEEKEYKEKAKELITPKGDYFKCPIGTYDTVDNCLNAMWRYKVSEKKRKSLENY